MAARLAVTAPLVTGQRVLDFLLPVGEGRSVAVPRRVRPRPAVRGARRMGGGSVPELEGPEAGELARAGQLYREPKHPYSQALLSAVPVPAPSAPTAKQLVVDGQDTP